jgi:phosphatidylinositol 4-kinase B
LVCYILQIKDRHNGNILVHEGDGSLIHIDFGFILASRLLNFETAPFKITGDIIRLLGGMNGSGFRRFRERMIEGYQALHEDNEKIIILVKILAKSQSDLPCFKRGVNEAINELC